ncbi:MAG: OsmC family protein [Kofleriaceae bacterium]|jgi:osmotically inducible protein OsmC|nr:OsmC family protein [Kofleriaceae bacterium]
MNRTSTAVWQGTGADGQGRLSTQSGAFVDQPYSFKARFQAEDGKAGTNPEELLGAAHAGCFTMALAFRCGAAGHPPSALRTEARVDMVKTEGGWTIPSIHLTCVGQVPGLSAERFTELAADAKANCPVSKALAVTITLDARLA